MEYPSHNIYAMPPLKFVLTGFNTSIELTEPPILYQTSEDIPNLDDVSAVAIIYADPAVMRSVFQVRLNAPNPLVNVNSDGGYYSKSFINKYYVKDYRQLHNLFGTTSDAQKRGFINAMMDASYTDPSNIIHIESKDAMKIVTNWNGKDPKNLVPHDFMYYLATQIYPISSSSNIDNFVPFIYQSEFIEDIRTKCDFSNNTTNIYSKIITESLFKVSANTVFNNADTDSGWTNDSTRYFKLIGINDVSANENLILQADTNPISSTFGPIGSYDPSFNNFMTDSDTSIDNVCRTLFKQMVNDNSGARFTSEFYGNTEVGLPFVTGDSISFRLTIQPSDGNETGDGYKIDPRTYEICMILDPSYEELNTVDV